MERLPAFQRMEPRRAARTGPPTPARLEQEAAMPRLAAIALSLGTVALSACDGLFGPSDYIHGSGLVVEEDRVVSGFTGVSLETQGEVVVILGDAEALHLQGEDNMLAEIITEVEDGTLRIRTPRGVSLRPSRPLVFTVTLASLDHLVNSGSGSIEADTVIAPDLTLVVSGSGSVYLGIANLTDLVSIISGSGGVSIADLQASTLQTTVSGSGPFLADQGQADSHVLAIRQLLQA